MDELVFLFDNQLIAALEELIRKAKHRLLLISPFIDLDARMMDALREKKCLHDFQLSVLFGKNEGNYKRSMRGESLQFFMEFPNVEIRYNERLHAKFYQNDTEFIVTSLNLYDYSLANNIEVGVKGQHSSKGQLWKAIDVPLELIDNSIDKVKENVLGMTKEVNPIEKFKSIFESSDLKYKTEPKTVEKSGILGFMGAKKLDGFTVKHSNLSGSNNGKSESQITKLNQTDPKSSDLKYISVSQLSKITGMSTKELTIFMQNKGLVNGEIITNNGKEKGLLMKNYMGKNYIAYPNNLPELKELGVN